MLNKLHYNNMKLYGDWKKSSK